MLCILKMYYTVLPVYDMHKVKDNTRDCNSKQFYCDPFETTVL